MSEAERLKWDDRYATGSYGDRTHPTALLADWIGRIPRGRALDVACGAGRNAIYLASEGFSVDALDISATALERLASRAHTLALEISTIEADLDAGKAALPAGPYALIVLVRYVNMPILDALTDRLAPGGVLLCEQHLTTDEDVVGPRNPAFRLSPGELAAAVPGLQPLYYREGIVEDPDGRRAALAQLIACNPRDDSQRPA